MPEMRQHENIDHGAKMKTLFFTGGVGAKYELMAKNLKFRFELLNPGVPMFVIPVSMFQTLRLLNASYWIKAWLWDFAGDVDRIGWIDPDVIPINPMKEIPAAPFSAVLDCERTAYAERRMHSDFAGIKSYFNNGFFIAARESIESFERLKKERHNPIHGNCIEQTWQNKVVDETVGVNLLPQRWNDIFGVRPDTIFRHFAGGERPKQDYWATAHSIGLQTAHYYLRNQRGCPSYTEKIDYTVVKARRSTCDRCPENDHEKKVCKKTGAVEKLSEMTQRHGAMCPFGYWGPGASWKGRSSSRKVNSSIDDENFSIL